MWRGVAVMGGCDYRLTRRLYLRTAISASAAGRREPNDPA
jgi:hypothetical protein